MRQCNYLHCELAAAAQGPRPWVEMSAHCPLPIYNSYVFFVGKADFKPSARDLVACLCTATLWFTRELREAVVCGWSCFLEVLCSLRSDPVVALCVEFCLAM